MACVIQGCLAEARSPYTHKEGAICTKHWRALPIALRQRFWKETNFGEISPSADLIKDMNDAWEALVRSRETNST